ncbi:MAG: hypothetical protein AABX23_00655 [Nanoarchaeota archaeon]
MNKSRGLLIVFVVISLLVVFTIYELNIFDISLAPSRKQPCITPPAYPQLIMQSVTICPRVYNYGIGIGSDNVKITCQPGNLFNGNSWTGANGLTISGRRNVTVEGCDFANFKGNGIFVGNVTNYTSEINLLAVKSSLNNGSGLFVGYNVVNIHVNLSDIRNNNKDGVLFTSTHFGLVNYSNSTLFPAGIYLFKNRIINNRLNGINFDAFDYDAYLPVSPYLINNSILISENNISENYKSGIQNLGFWTDSAQSQIKNNFINSNGFYLNGSGIAIIASKSPKILTSGPYTSFVTNFNYIISNDIINNAVDGIYLHIPHIVGNNSLPACISHPGQLCTGMNINVGDVFANYISQNNRYGVSSNFADSSIIDSLSTENVLLQNDIIYNGREGVYLNGKTNPDIFSHVGSEIICNDIIYNGIQTNGNSNGIEIRESDRVSVVIRGANIIGNNLIGLLIENVEDTSISPDIYATNNYFGFNKIGLEFNNSNESSFVRSNDFDQNILLQALDVNSPNDVFERNWWSDYSPTCVDSQPDGWCDVPRPIPIANQDIQPKAGSWWGHKNRGYFVRANPGVVPKTSCQTIILPPLPIITVPNFGGTSSIPGNVSNPPGGSGTTGTTGST